MPTCNRGYLAPVEIQVDPRIVRETRLWALRVDRLFDAFGEGADCSHFLGVCQALI